MSLRSHSLKDAQYLFLKHSDIALDKALKKIIHNKYPVVLDIGAGNMWLNKYFKKQSANYIGIDLTPKYKLHAIAIAEKLPIKKNSVDTILYISVLEHVENPHQVIKEAKRVLKPLGNIIIQTHGIYSFHPCPQDHWRWTHTGLEKILTQFGFEVNAIFPSGNTLITYLTIYIQGINLILDKIPLTNRLKPIITLVLNLLGVLLHKIIKLKTSFDEPGNLIMNYTVIANKI